MTSEELDLAIEALASEEALRLEPRKDFDGALIGVASTDGVLVYDTAKVISALVSQDMTELEAWEYFEYNMMGFGGNEGCPVYITMIVQE